MAIDSRTKLAWRRHGGGVEQPNDARIRTELRKDVVEQQLGRLLGLFGRQPVGFGKQQFFGFIRHLGKREFCKPEASKRGNCAEQSEGPAKA